MPGTLLLPQVYGPALEQFVASGKCQWEGHTKLKAAQLEQGVVSASLTSVLQYCTFMLQLQRYRAATRDLP